MSSPSRLWQPSKGIVFQSTPTRLTATRAYHDSSDATSDTPAPVQKRVYSVVDNSDLYSDGWDDTAIPPPEEEFEGEVDKEEEKTATQKEQEHDEGLVEEDDEGLVLKKEDDVDVDIDMESLSSEEALDDAVPPETGLPYKIRPDLYRAARNAPEGSPASFWTYELYRHQEDASQSVKVHYCKSALTTERVCRNYFLDEPVLGFDLEWMRYATPSHGARRNVCLVQLASPRRIALFHVAIFPLKDSRQLVPPTLKKILEDPAVAKAGVWIKGDSQRMRRFLSVDMRGVFELSRLHRLVKYARTREWKMINKKLVSLADQIQEWMELPMFKGMDVRSSDWSKPLDEEQIKYSASDAFAGVQLYDILERERQTLDPAQPRPAFVEEDKPMEFVKSEDKDEESGSETKVEVDNGEDVDEEAPKTPKAKTAKTAKPKTPKTPKSPETPRDPRIVEADAWVEQYRAATTIASAKITAAPLRAYYLWHTHVDLDPDRLARLLRDPPLKTTTVAGYVLSVVAAEKLPFNVDRVVDELLPLMPASTVLSRYRGLAKQCNYIV